MQLWYSTTWGHRQLTGKRWGGMGWSVNVVCVWGSLIKWNMIQKTLLARDTSCPTREEIRQMSQMSLFSPPCFALVVVFFQIQTVDRQCLSMFSSPEWIFLVHPSVRLFSEVRGGARGHVCVWAGMGVWVGATDQTQYISHRSPNFLIVWSNRLI